MERDPIKREKEIINGASEKTFKEATSLVHDIERKEDYYSDRVHTSRIARMIETIEARQRRY